MQLRISSQPGRLYRVYLSDSTHCVKPYKEKAMLENILQVFVYF